MREKIKALREARAKLINDAQEKGNKDNLSAEELANINAMLDEAAAKQKEIETYERLLTSAAALDQPRDIKAGLNDDRSEESNEAKKRYKAVFQKYLRNGINELDQDERKLLRAAHQNIGDAKGAQEAATGNKGGFTVPEDFWAQVEVGMEAYDGVREAGAQVIRSTSGANLPWPTTNDTATKGRRIAEGAGANNQDITFGSIQLGAYTYTSDLVLVSNELLEDTGIDLDELIGRMLGERVGRILNEEFTTANGADKPNGVVTASTLGKTTAAVNAITFAEMVDLKFSLNRAYRKGAKFMFNDETFKYLSLLKDDDNKYLLRQSGREGEPETILGHEFQINDDMASIAASAKTVLFGNFYNYKIRDVGNPVVRRLEERFADDNQTAFVLFSRHDGDLSEPGTGVVRHLIQKAA